LFSAWLAGQTLYLEKPISVFFSNLIYLNCRQHAVSKNKLHNFFISKMYVVNQFTGQQIFGLVFFILIFWCFLMFFGALSPK